MLPKLNYVNLKNNGFAYTMKRRKLSFDDEVVLIYEVDVGFIQQAARFQEYRSIIYNGVKHDIPVFKRKGSEVTGLECFWLLASEADALRIDEIQRELIGLQIKVLEIANIEGYDMPEKIKDPEIKKLAKQRAQFRAGLIEKMGYDPLDYSWVEKRLAITPLEKKWFSFQAFKYNSEPDPRDGDWEYLANEFFEKYGEKILIQDAFELSKKWKRFIIGAWKTIAAQNPNVDDWEKAAIKTEAYHRESEERMIKWSKSKEGNYPIVKVKEPVLFKYGPYFDECAERIPKLFTDRFCTHIKPGVVLRVIAYDSQEKFIRLDFTPEIRALIKPGQPEIPLWQPPKPDYCIDVMPSDIEEQLELLEPLS